MIGHHEVLGQFSIVNLSQLSIVAQKSFEDDKGTDLIKVDANKN